MRNQKIQDERILMQKRKIGSDAFQITFYGLLLSVLVQQYMFNAPFSQYAVEIILFIAISIYIIIRNIMVGNDLFESSKHSPKIVVINSLVSGLVITIINTTLNYIKLGDLFKTNSLNTILISAMTFLCATIISFIGFEILYLINKRKQKQIQSILDSDE